MTIKELKNIIECMDDDVIVHTIDNYVTILVTDIEPDICYNPEEWSNWFNMDCKKIKHILIF